MLPQRIKEIRKEFKEINQWTLFIFYIELIGQENKIEPITNIETTPTTMNKDKLFGFIGLGNMGQPMAQHIARKVEA